MASLNLLSCLILRKPFMAPGSELEIDFFLLTHTGHFIMWAVPRSQYIVGGDSLRQMLDLPVSDFQYED